MSNRLEKLYNQINFKTHYKLQYKPKGYIHCSRRLGGFNNQLEQHWILNILAQRTGRVLVEKELRPIDTTFGNRVNLSELVNRPKYLSNLATVPEREYLKHCGVYSHQIDLPNNDRFNFDELEFMIQKINSLPELDCISIGHFPSYDFFDRVNFTNWIPTFKELILPNFEFSSLIKNQADHFIKEKYLEDGNYISIQFRRGDFKQHCNTLFNSGRYNWGFGYQYEDTLKFKKNNFTEFENHCYPSINSLIDRIAEFTLNFSNPIAKALVLTNAKAEEIEGLKAQLNSKQLEFLRFEPYPELIPADVKWTITHSLAVEMELSIRGNYWFGNRHSTINSNLLALRLNKSLETSTFI